MFAKCKYAVLTLRTIIVLKCVRNTFIQNNLIHFQSKPFFLSFHYLKPEFMVVPHHVQWVTTVNSGLKGRHLCNGRTESLGILCNQEIPAPLKILYVFSIILCSAGVVWNFETILDLSCSLSTFLICFQSIYNIIFCLCVFYIYIYFYLIFYSSKWMKL